MVKMIEALSASFASCCTMVDKEVRRCRCVVPWYCMPYYKDKATVVNRLYCTVVWAQVQDERLMVLKYLLQHGAKPDNKGLIRISTRVKYKRLKVSE